MSHILILFLFVFSAQAEFINKYPAKKIKNIEFLFGSPFVDNYKWMENSADNDLYVWRKNQNIQTKDYLDKESLNFYISVQEKIQKFKSSMKQDSSKPPLHDTPFAMNYGKKSNKKQESSLYKIKIEDILETGGLYGSLQRISIIDKSTEKVVQTLVGYYYQILTWLDDETYTYTNYRSVRLGLGATPYIGIHKVGSHYTDDKIIHEGKVGDYFYFHKYKGETYLNLFESARRNVGIHHINLRTGELNLKVAFGTETQQNGESAEKDGYYVYYTDYKDRNLGVLEKVSITSGQVDKLYTAQDFVTSSLHYIKEGLYFLIGYRDGESIAGVLTNNTFSEIPGLEAGKISFRSHSDGKVQLAWQSYGNIFKNLEFDLSTKKLSLISSHSYPTEIETEKIHYTAANGEKASIWISKKPDTKLNPDTPLLIYGYGGWYHTELPRFNRMDSVGWIEKGGVFAVVAVPGSLAYGMQWNKMAKAHNRVKSFDSFAAAAKELIKRGFTSREKIGMFGASNGGLLVAGTLLRHPKVFKAAVPMVGVYNLLDCAEKGYVWELGDPCNKSEFNKLRKMSPLQNIRRANYPATMVMTADQDSVTKPFESYKFAAKLQEFSRSKEPVLLYTKIGGGHSMSSGSKKEAAEYSASIYAFFEKTLGL